MAFELPKLSYSHDALEPYISAKTIEYHYGKHHQAYVNNVNSLIAGTEFQDATLEEIIMKLGLAAENKMDVDMQQFARFLKGIPENGGERGRGVEIGM